MSTTFSDLVNSTGTFTITLNSLAASATAGRQTTVLALIDGSGLVPEAVDIEVSVVWTTGTPSADKTIYIFAARSLDNSAFETGPPAIGASDAALTFANSPVGSAPTPTDMLLLGAITIAAQSETHNKVFRLFAPPPYLALVLLNNSGIALASSGNSIQYRKRFGDGR